MEKKVVLLIDDDKMPMKFYIRALEQKGFEVKQCFEPDCALEFMQKRGTQIAVIILDIMMPPGKIYENEETNQGLRTGVFLLKNIRKEGYCQNTPVIVLTNVKNPETLSEFEVGPLLTVKQKMGCPPFELVKLVEEMTLSREGN